MFKGTPRAIYSMCGCQSPNNRNPKTSLYFNSIIPYPKERTKLREVEHRWNTFQTNTNTTVTSNDKSPIGTTTRWWMNMDGIHTEVVSCTSFEPPANRTLGGQRWGTSCCSYAAIHNPVVPPLSVQRRQSAREGERERVSSDYCFARTKKGVVLLHTKNWVTWRYCIKQYCDDDRWRWGLNGAPYLCGSPEELIQLRVAREGLRSWLSLEFSATFTNTLDNYVYLFTVNGDRFSHTICTVTNRTIGSHLTLGNWQRKNTNPPPRVHKKNTKHAYDVSQSHISFPHEWRQVEISWTKITRSRLTESISVWRNRNSCEIQSKGAGLANNWNRNQCEEMTL